ncbi:MAG: hypothetical protein MRY83_22710 [Flavobacteriales bacterium]|nr:hypothetical protein [Flavobacteriales bacterium]
MKSFEIQYSLFVLLCAVITFFFRKRFTKQNLLIKLSILFGIELLGLLSFSIDQFAFLRLLAHIIFIHAPLILIGMSVYKRKWWLLIIAISLVGVALYAFLYEPYHIQITEYNIKSEKLNHDYRVVLMSDIQTDNVGPYETELIEKVQQLDPDFIIFTGDYAQCDNIVDHDQVIKDLSGLMLPLTKRIPSFASGGDVDFEDWRYLFSEQTQIVDNTLNTNYEDIRIIGYSDLLSFQTDKNVQPSDSFTIAFGHAPDFVLSNMGADLCLAGHTHGGQVQIPFFGPIMTLSKVRRSWASGMSEFGWGQYLIVSNGIGMERANAPRLRFNCPPEIVLINLVSE